MKLFAKDNSKMEKVSEIDKLNELNDFIYDLKISDQYIAKSQYKDKIEEHKETIDFFKVLDKSHLLDDFCKKNRLSEKGVKQLISVYEDIENIFAEHNKKFIKEQLLKEKDYLDNILHDVDPQIRLDDNQREVVLSDEDYTLVIAGAGAGKTTTVAAKTKYLVDKKSIPENEILIVSFTNKAVEELRERINKNLGLKDVVISTFHSIGNAIIKTQNSEPMNIVSEGNLYYLLLEYFKRSVFSNESLVKKLLLFFSTYFEVPYEEGDLGKFLNELSKTNYTTLKSDLNDFRQEIIDRRSKKKITIQNEIVRSYQEVQIANYLYLHSIDYKYEPTYPYNIKLANKPYTPDFFIKQGDNEAYIEHFGISQSGENSMYTEEQLKKYKRAVNNKIMLHKQHNTKLIYTFSQYDDGRSLLQHLNEELKKAGFVLKKKDEKEVLHKIVETEESKYVSKLIILICRFINLFKTNGYTIKEFDKFRKSTRNVRNQLFLDITKECYLEYERYLKENNAIDFQDMINNSAAILHEMAQQEEKLHFKYVIVDEYQDISRQRFDLVGALHKVCDAKIIAVGDDWQSIYAFSGSDVQLFLEFEKKMGYANILKIENTYRNSQEVIDIAGNFIQKNETQIRKTLKSPKHIENPINIYTYDPSRKDSQANNKSGGNYNMALATQQCLDDIVEYNKKEKKNADKVLILGRYNFDLNNLDKSGLFEVSENKRRVRSVKYPELKLTFMTAHASKGLGYDNVVIINCQNARFGFPSKIQDDPVLKHVKIEDNSYDFAEERRLFYVAMTRTKNRVFCVAPQRYPSEFLIELKNDYEKVVKYGEWDEADIRGNSFSKSCPLCGYPLQLKYKPAYGLRLHICTNDPELCGFMTNEIKGGKLQIMKCDKCQDGYLIVKPGKKEYFLGCTNFKDGGTGCNNTLSREKYFEIYNLTPDKPIVPRKQERNNYKPERDFTIVPDKNVQYQKKDYDSAESKEVLTKAIKVVISCVNHVSQKVYLGKDKIFRILKGTELEIKNNLNYQDIPEYGIFKSLKDEQINALIETMIDFNLLHKTKGLYPVLHPTPEGKDFHEDKSDIRIDKLFAIYKNNVKAEVEKNKETKEEK